MSHDQIVRVERSAHWQYGYSGHVINFPQNVIQFFTTLPRHLSEFNIIVVRKVGSSQSHHREFHVRRSVVLSALRFLIANNKYFSNITIDNEALLQLPQDGDLPNIPSITYDDDDAEDMITESEAGSGQDPYNTHLSTTFVPSNCQTRTEQENL